MLRRGIASTARHPDLTDEVPRWQYRASENSAVLRDVMVQRLASTSFGARAHCGHDPIDMRPRVRARAESAMRVPPELRRQMRAKPWPDGRHYRTTRIILEMTPEYYLANGRGPAL